MASVQAVIGMSDLDGSGTLSLYKDSVPTTTFSFANATRLFAAPALTPHPVTFSVAEYRQLILATHDWLLGLEQRFGRLPDGPSPDHEIESKLRRSHPVVHALLKVEIEGEKLIDVTYSTSTGLVTVGTRPAMSVTADGFRLWLDMHTMFGFTKLKAFVP